LKSGQVFKEFTSKRGDKVILRSQKWEDLDQALIYVNKLFDEAEKDPNFGVPLAKKETLESEAKWLADVLVRLELGNLISVVAEIKGIMVGNSIVTIPHGFENHRGDLGISVSAEYRDQGIGF
jgi:hypothetical protein